MLKMKRKNVGRILSAEGSLIKFKVEILLNNQIRNNFKLKTLSKRVITLYMSG